MADFLRSWLPSPLFALAISALTGMGIAVSAAADANAQRESYRIVKIVNDEPITSYDVASRLRFVSATSRTPLTGEDAKRFTQQITENLINEQLQLQESKRLGINVDDSEIQAAVGRIEQRNGLSAGQLIRVLTQRNVDANTLINQIRATLAWRQAVGQRLRARVTVTEEDIDFYLDGLRQKGGTEYLLGEIFISAHDAVNLPQAKATAERLLNELRRGADFADLARQFSQAPTAATGGDTGWIRANQLEAQLADAVEQLQPGQVSPPVAVADGYYLLALRRARTFGVEGQQETVYDLRRVFLPFPAGAGERAKRQILIRVAKARPSLNNCAAVERFATRAGDPQNGNMGELSVSQMPQGLQPIVLKLKPGRISRLLRLQDGALVLMLCGKKTRSLGLPDRETVRENLLQREADVLARRYLRELRQDAIIQSLEDPA